MPKPHLRTHNQSYGIRVAKSGAMRGTVHNNAYKSCRQNLLVNY